MFPIWWPYFRIARLESLKHLHLAILIYKILARITRSIGLNNDFFVCIWFPGQESVIEGQRQVRIDLLIATECLDGIIVIYFVILHIVLSMSCLVEHSHRSLAS